MVLNDIQNNKTHLKTIEVVSFQQNTLLAKKYINIHVRNCRSPKIFRDITSDPASTGRESGDERGQDEKGKRERRREGMKGRKWNGREGRRDWRDIREEKGEEIGGKWLEGGWGEGCAHRYRGIDQARTQDFFWGSHPAPKARESRRRRGWDAGRGCPLPAEKFLYFKYENGAFLMGLE
jgi:hypothetical protein